MGAAPLRVGCDIAPPQKTNNIRSTLRAAAAEARITRVVLVEMTIATNGSIVDAKVLRSIPLLDEAPVDAVRQWRYTPTLLNGVAVAVIATVAVNFAQ